MVCYVIWLTVNFLVRLCFSNAEDIDPGDRHDFSDSYGMQGGLGISGTEGTFRAAAEATLHALRCSSTAQSEMLLSHCQEAGLIWSAAHHESALAKVLKAIRMACALTEHMLAASSEVRSVAVYLLVHWHVMGDTQIPKSVHLRST